MPGEMELPEVDCLSASQGNIQIAQMLTLPGEKSSQWKKQVSMWSSSLGSPSQALQLAWAGSQPERGYSPLLMRVEPRRGSVLTAPSISGFYPTSADGEGDLRTASQGMCMPWAPRKTQQPPRAVRPQFKNKRCLPFIQEVQSNDEEHRLKVHRKRWSSCLNHIPTE